MLLERRARLALRIPKRFTYVEGYAVFGPLSTPMEHAWRIDCDGFVAGPTCANGHDHVGVPFRHDYLGAVILAKNSYGLSDNEEMALPLLTGVHPAELPSLPYWASTVERRAPCSWSGRTSCELFVPGGVHRQVEGVSGSKGVLVRYRFTSPGSALQRFGRFRQVHPA